VGHRISGWTLWREKLHHCKQENNHRTTDGIDGHSQQHERALHEMA